MLVLGSSSPKRITLSKFLFSLPPSKSNTKFCNEKAKKTVHSFIRKLHGYWKNTEPRVPLHYSVNT